jgi:hypothetical protein
VIGQPALRVVGADALGQSPRRLAVCGLPLFGMVFSLFWDRGAMPVRRSRAVFVLRRSSWHSTAASQDVGDAWPIRFVDMLSPAPGRGVNRDLPGFVSMASTLDFGMIDRTGRGVDAALRFGFRHALQCADSV